MINNAKVLSTSKLDIMLWSHFFKRIYDLWIIYAIFLGSSGIFTATHHFINIYKLVIYSVRSNHFTWHFIYKKLDLSNVNSTLWKIINEQSCFSFTKPFCWYVHNFRHHHWIPHRNLLIIWIWIPHRSLLIICIWSVPFKYPFLFPLNLEWEYQNKISKWTCPLVSVWESVIRQADMTEEVIFKPEILSWKYNIKKVHHKVYVLKIYPKIPNNFPNKM